MTLRRLFTLCGFQLVAIGALAAPALAQTSDPENAAMAATDHPFLAGVTVVMTAAIVAAMIALVFWDRREMWKTQQAALAGGASTTLSETGLMARALGGSTGLAISGGTANLNVGDTSPDFVASVGGLPTEVTWSIVEGAAAAELKPSSGTSSTATLKGKTPGAVRLEALRSVTAADGNVSTDTTELLVAVHPAPTGGRTISLSSLGKGLGLFTLSMVALGFGVAAAIAGQLSAELATFLGTAFGVGAGGAAVAGASGQSKQGDSTGTAPGSAEGGLP